MIFTYTFFQNALIGALLASVLCAIIGTYIVTRRLVIVGGGMAHASLGGVGLGAYLGFSPLWGAALFSILTGFGIRHLSGNRSVREDSAIAMLWTFGMSIGILFAYLTPGFYTDLPAYLFGNILSISHTDLIILGSLTFITFVLYEVFHDAIISVASDRNFARTQGLPVNFIENLLTVFIALTIVGCLHLMGIVMVISLLSVPQMTAALFVRTYRHLVWLSALFGFAGCMGGLTLSYYADVPGGAAIILLSISFYALCRFGKYCIGKFV